jgi:hypothetical protein
MLHESLYGHPTDRVRLPGEGGGHHASNAASARPGGATAPLIASFAANEDLDGTDDVDSRVAQARGSIPADTIKEAEALFKAGLSRFRSSAILHIFAARFYSVFCGNAHLLMR